MKRSNDVIADCRTVLGEVTRPELSDKAALAERALAALADGHVEAAQALAVIVAEKTIKDEFGNYAAAVAATAFPDGVALAEMRLRTAVAPVGAFYTRYFGRPDEAISHVVSRHATVHQPGATTLRQEHALVAAMLLTSLLRAIDEDHAAADAA